jgi:hypothetical protein
LKNRSHQWEGGTRTGAPRWQAAKPFLRLVLIARLDATTHRLPSRGDDFSADGFGEAMRMVENPPFCVI